MKRRIIGTLTLAGVIFLISIFILPKASPVVALTAAKPGALGALSAPSRIIISSAKVDARVTPIGVTKTGNLDVPNNYVDVGWYSYGPIPGQIGSAVLDGHVDNGSKIDGVFKHLKNVKTGDEIYIVDANGQVGTFKVVASNVYKTDKFPAESVFHEYDGATLKIITCHGKWLSSRKTYDQRLVVTAVRV